MRNSRICSGALIRFSELRKSSYTSSTALREPSYTHIYYSALRDSRYTHIILSALRESKIPEFKTVSWFVCRLL